MPWRDSIFPEAERAEKIENSDLNDTFSSNIQIHWPVYLLSSICIPRQDSDLNAVKKNRVLELGLKDAIMKYLR